MQGMRRGRILLDGDVTIPSVYVGPDGTRNDEGSQEEKITRERVGAYRPQKRHARPRRYGRRSNEASKKQELYYPA